ncbi:MAG TPA: glycosyltransferase family 4 protein [Smithellaceae bacterium]|nr:glycosyltransferase family 4 protein [Smithellaceae bacterium]HRS89404.1 glycosyltransferase family 4 protein [Smithellaceae bacterium]HRV26186.1 glycosyltransferase family 4 protein [Smithellaceae bacterium]
MKKIALAMEKFSKYGGGAESYSVALATTLIKHGWEVHVFGEKWDNEPKEVRFHKIYIPKYFPSWIKQLLFVWQHKRMTTQKHFDIVMGFGNTICMNVYQSHGGVHWFSTARKVYSEKSILRRIIKRILILFSAKQWTRAWIEAAAFRINPRPKIIAIADMIKRDMETFFHISPDEIEIVYNGVDTKRFNNSIQQRFRGKLRKQWGLSEKDTAFLFVSYELKKKGIEPLVEAAAKLKAVASNDFRVIVAGRQPYRSLKRLIEKLDLEKTVTFVGRVKSMEEYYANSDVFVLPTYYDACSLVVIEAMASGLPSITTVYNGAAGIISDGINGYVISHPPDATELADKMYLLMDKQRREKMSREAALSGQKYSAERNHREIIKILDEKLKNQ